MRVALAAQAGYTWQLHVSLLVVGSALAEPEIPGYLSTGLSELGWFRYMYMYAQGWSMVLLIPRAEWTDEDAHHNPCKQGHGVNMEVVLVKLQMYYRPSATLKQSWSFRNTYSIVSNFGSTGDLAVHEYIVVGRPDAGNLWIVLTNTGMCVVYICMLVGLSNSFEFIHSSARMDTFIVLCACMWYGLSSSYN